MSIKFHIGDIISITTGKLVSPSHMDGVNNILNYMTGVDIITHQFPGVCNVCKELLLKQMPWLAEISVPAELNDENWKSWMDNIVQKYGEFHEVEKIM